MTIATGAAGEFTDNFNPWSPSANNSTEGFIYEPLFYVNSVKANTYDPWLATGYKWADGGKQITFTLRHGVKYTNGQPFTSADVVFTIKEEMKNAGLNTFSLPYKSVTASGPYSVTVDFSRPSYQDFDYLAGKTFMVLPSQWSSVKNPVTYTNPHPIGTGSYELSTFSPQAITVTANPHYYFPGLPKIKTFRYLAYSGNTSSDAAIEAGEVDWAANYIPNIKQTYLDKSSNNQIVNIPTDVGFLIANDVKGPTASLAVRRAMTYGIDEESANKALYAGEDPPTNLEMLLLPNFKQYANPALAKANVTYDPAKAEQILEKAGYKKGSNGIFVAPDGKPLDITCQVNNGYTNSITQVQLAAENLKKIGIDMTVQLVSASEIAANTDTGNFQLVSSGAGYTSNLYDYYYDLFDSAVSAPFGKTASGDYGRFKSAEFDHLMTEVAAQKTTAAQAPLFRQAEALLAKDLPYIPQLVGGSGAEFNAGVVKNYPTTSNAYAFPDSWAEPDAGWVAMHLEYAGS